MNYNVSFNTDFRRNPYKGRFIVIEGMDGSGKTTQAKRLVEYLEEKKIESVYTKEPTDEITGKLIRKILSGKLALAPVAFQYLFAADRAVHQVEISSYLEKGITVVSDRYFWSSAVYGMVDRETSKENDRERILVALSILSMYHRFLLPDCTFYLKVSTQEAVRRIDKKAEELEIYEEKEKLEKIREGYEWLAKKFTKEIAIIDGEKSVEEVTHAIVASIK
ncbi:MAG: dTMP kinase [Patescibacteria group bacterium]